MALYRCDIASSAYLKNAPDLHELDSLQKDTGEHSVLVRAKKGEGSHGGHIVGHTRSGKPIYEATSSKYGRLKGFNRASDKHNASVTRRSYPRFTLEDHDDARKYHGDKASEHRTLELRAGNNGNRSIARAHALIAASHEAADNGHKRAKQHMEVTGHKYPQRAYHASNGGAEIHDISHPAYSGISNSVMASRKDGTIAYQNARAHNVSQIEQNLGHYDLADHKAAIQHHQDLASKYTSADQGGSVKGPVGPKRKERADLHTSIALAHSDAAEKKQTGSWMTGRR